MASSLGPPPPDGQRPTPWSRWLEQLWKVLRGETDLDSVRGTVANTKGTQTLLQKTLTAPAISAPAFSGTATGALTGLLLVSPTISSSPSVAPSNISFHGNASPNVAGTYYLRPWHYSATVSSNEVKQVMPFAGTVRAAYFTAASSAVGGTHTFTVRKNGVDQSVTFTVAAGSIVGSDAAHSFSFVAGDVLSVKIVANVGVSTGYNDPTVALSITQA